jgi:archaellum component FlaC
LQIKYD